MKQILVIATGGTIACRSTEKGLMPQIEMEDFLNYVPKIREMCGLHAVQLMVLHGTDTMAYTAAALSYLIQNSRKPIVLTGAQKPINEDITDAKSNVIQSILYATSDVSTNVSFVFDGEVIAGTRGRKVRSKSFNAFSSVNFPHKAVIRDNKVFHYIEEQGYGYNVKFLYEEIGKILGLNQKHNIIVIGAGNLGQALANYVKFEKLGFVITALFDVNPALEGVTVRGIKIHMLDELDDYCKDHVVDIAALPMPKEKADAIANRLVNLGIQAIWNFAHVDLDLIDKDVVVENVHLSDSLMQLSYNIVKNKQNK